MALYYNKVILIGRAAREPKFITTERGKSIAYLTIATTESYKDKNTGERIETTEWHNLVFFGKTAEIVSQYVSKGDLIMVEGSLRTVEQLKDGIAKKFTNINVTSFAFAESKKEKERRQSGFGESSEGFGDDEASFNNSEDCPF